MTSVPTPSPKASPSCAIFIEARGLATISLALCAAILAGCAAPAVAPEPAPTPAPVVAAQTPAAPAPAPAPAAAPTLTVSQGATALREGVKSFEVGEYRRAETRLGDSLKQGLANKDEQVRAHKTLAFVYCVTKRTALCEKSFKEAFTADSSFELSRAERGHPVWGPVFTKVQKQQK